ncbi:MULTISPECIES: hypothetical protein [Streptomyces]|uniref:hypothetical protein n=1 Tax=Streptomyces TaxID=1883 RepID=UPI001112A6F7|nr:MULTISPECIES: hypothetical protein [Streptomyces]WTD25617.1 hypothetical protein OH737_14200 [Streptomyces anulatus]
MSRELKSTITWKLFGVVTVSAILMTGCSMADKKSGDKLEKRSGPEVEIEIATRSSEIMDMMATKGKMTELGPRSYACAREVQGGRVVRHPWSLYGVSNDRLETAMKNLVARLPDKGWKIVENGDDGSRNRNQQILAVHLDTLTQMDISWKKALDTNRPMITASVYSRCFIDTSR